LENRKRILVIRLSSIGDVILTTPVLKAFKEKYPESIIDFLVIDKFKDAISLSPYVDNLLLFNKEKNDGLSNLIKFAKELSKNEYDYVFDLHSKFRSKIITFILSKFYKVKSYTYKKRAFWKSILVNLKLIKYEVDNTIIKNYFSAFKDFELKYQGEDLNFSFELELKNKFEEYKNSIVFAVGASKETKKWTVEGFGKLAKKLYETYGKFEGLDIIIAGDIKNSRVAKSNYRMLTRLGAKVRFVCPDIYKDETLGEVVDFDEVIGEVDVCMLLRVQHERHAEKMGLTKEEYHEQFGLTPERYEKLKETAIIMHPAPVNRDVEIASELVEAPKSVIFEQMKNGMFMRQAILEYIIEKNKM